MDPSKPFTILRLPFLAIEEVFKTMHPFEIINFSMISKRAKGIAKQMSFSPKYSIDLYINKTLDIMIYGTKDLVSCTYVMTSDKKMEGKSDDAEHNGYIIRKLYKYSKDPVEEWKLLFKYVREIFKKQSIDAVSMQMDAFPEQNVSIIDFLKANVKSVNGCWLFQTDIKINVYKHTAYFLDNIKINSVLFSNVYVNNVNFDGRISKNLKELYIINSEWIGFKRLLEIDSKTVTLKNYKISDEQWNLFFKIWIEMKTHVNLEYLELDYRNIEQFRALVLHDIPHEVVDLGVKRVLNISFNDTQEVTGGIDIRRIDGKTATFFDHYTGFSMSVH
ncbi:hypothetical protein CRE_09791 [Caenorhabditis remanei]|uniref:F-box domain-containing protein n=1 Tax=Caenorhabditis remanei TaxID=31234 RepID=E3NDF5_CAERE|nr:hypothetical protein CRE_09791 [Caenorhabditis remanei]